MEDQKLKYVPISELEKKNDHWFSEDNKRFFKSLWDSYALQNEGSVFAYFISSEKHESLYAHINEPRMYTIRKFNMRTGDFASDIDDNSIFKFQKYDTKKKAEKTLREYLKTEPINQEKLDAIKQEIETTKYDIERTQKKLSELETELKSLTK